ncbi:hypothetical protein LZ554_008714 [Drepanopeziza brunnea f. sp. 'monogermtubi']|nr:hypothetical protein LZ554_008714 [Drepanopeziza brunnea f. sp. 'monogermtubi']
MATLNAKPVHSLVLDSGPIIKNDPHVNTLLGRAENIYTIPAVIDEIRDAATRARIESTLLPFLKLRSPRPASVKVVTDFARKTGDLEVLSRPDVHLIALTYELECERNHGDWRLRREPGQKGLNGEPPKSLEEGTVKKDVVESAKKENVPAPIPETRGAWGTKIPIAEDSEPKSIDQVLAGTHLSDPQVQPPEPVIESTHNGQAQSSQQEPVIEDPESTPEVQGPEPSVGVPTEPVSQPEPEVEEVIESDSEGSDGEGWITPSNIKKVQAKADKNFKTNDKEDQNMQVAVITTDFAMQNVILRMNLNLLSSGLQRIRQLKTWVLRCHACFAITKDMARQFCPKCGKDTLMRTSCSTNKDGKVFVHLKKNMQWNTRGNVYSIPKPVAGTSNGKLVQGGGKGGWGQGLILAEDQKEYVQAMTSNRRKKEKDLMDEDFLPGLLSGDRGRAGGRLKVGAGRNVNSKKRH